MKPLQQVTLFFSVLALAGVTLAQANKADGPRNAAQVYDRALASLEKDFVPAAEAMPEDKYGFAPTAGEFKGVRTFASQVKHVAATNYEFAAAILGEKPPVEIGSEENGPDSVKSKAEIIEFLNNSFAYLRKAVDTIDQNNIVTPIKNPFGDGTVTRLGMATIALSHPMDHYGQMVEYLRMNGVIPPASR